MKQNELLTPKTLMQCDHPAEVDEKLWNTRYDWNLLKAKPGVAMFIRGKAISPMGSEEASMWFDLMADRGSFDQCTRVLVRSVLLN